MANDYQGFSPVDFARGASTTLADHITKEEDAVSRNYRIGALIQSRGRVLLKRPGRGFDWPVQYRLHTVEGNTGETARNFARKNLWKTAQLEHRGYQVTDAMYMREFEENSGKAGIVKVYDNFVERLTKSLKHALGTQYYLDGNAAGNELMWHGLESLFTATQTINISTGAARTANAADKVMYPNTTYAALSTALGAYGGANESGYVWPEGIADSQFDFWTPLIVNYTSNAFNGASDTFLAQGDEAMRYAIIHSQRNMSDEGQITNVMLARNLYMDFLNLIDGKEQINITSENSLWALGFKNVVVFDGVEVSWEAGIAPNLGYGFNYDSMEIRSPSARLLKPEGPEYDIDTQAFKAVVSTLSNLKFNSPRNFFKLKNAA